MNKLNLTHEAGYPFDVNFLAFMQAAYSLFNHFGHLAGNLAIISGCEEVGNTISAGTVYINGELLPISMENYCLLLAELKAILFLSKRKLTK